jgi:hypothetical protein
MTGFIEEHISLCRGLTPEERILIEVEPSCKMGTLTRLCNCDLPDTDLVPIYAWEQRTITKGYGHGPTHRCMQNAKKSMYLFAKNWCERVEEAYRAAHMPPLSVAGIQSRVHDAMLPLLAEICIVNAAVFPMDGSIVMQGGHRAEIVDSGVVDCSHAFKRRLTTRVCSTFKNTPPVEAMMQAGVRLIDPCLCGLRGSKRFETRLQFADTGLVGRIKICKSFFEWGFKYCNCIGCHHMRLRMTRADSEMAASAGDPLMQSSAVRSYKDFGVRHDSV